MKSPASVAKEYEAALQDYLAGAGERALQRAYQLGRRALGEGVGLFGLVSRHHAVLQEALERGHAQPRQFEAAQAFLAECLAPYEMAQREFRDAVEGLRQLNQRLETEAQRIAYALHDEASQLLVAVHLSLHALAREHPSVSARIREAQVQLDEVEQQLRRLSHELRPTILDDLGLMPALEELARGVTQRTGIPVEVRGRAKAGLSSPAATTMYRVIQEAITNAIRHGRPRRVDVLVENGSREVRCRVRDDGAGFDAQRILRGPSTGLGLLGMRERVGSLGGVLTIRSAPGEGCELSVGLPVRGRS